jgi:hypothetical protein
MDRHGKRFTMHNHARKTELFQITIIPPDAPFEGMYRKSSKHGGQHVLIKAKSKDSFLVSCRHITSHPHSSITFLKASCLVLEFKPRIFHHNTNHFFKILIDKQIKQR